MPDALPRVLVLRHASHQRDFYQVVEDWIRRYQPQYDGLLDVQDLPLRLPPDATRGHPYGAMVSWLQDPVQAWSQETYDQALAVQAQCDAAGMVVLNRVDHLPHAGKAEGARRMGAAGVRVPRMALVTDAAAFHATRLDIPLPLFVREDWGHGGLVYGARSMEEVRAIPLQRFRRPVAVEWIDVQDAQGLFCKYRYFAAGDIGISHHVQCSRTWITRGDNRVTDDHTRALELDYVARPDPHHAVFQKARQALGLDMVAFDYGLLADGTPVVWEANPFPVIKLSTGSLVYRNSALHRTLCAMLRLYVVSAGLHATSAIEDIVAYRSEPAG